jgi:hypothetical protein
VGGNKTIGYNDTQMDDDKINQPQSATSGQDDNGAQAKEGNIPRERIFDISPDLNISPITDIEYTSTIPEVGQISPEEKQTVQQKPQNENTFVQSDLSVPKNPTQIEKTIPQQSVPSPSINITPTNQASGTTRNQPASPPAKTIGTLHQEKFDKADAKGDLQSAISAIIPPEISKNGQKAQPKIRIDKSTMDASAIKPIRTYESDVAKIMSNKKASVASMVIAESEKAVDRNIVSEDNIKESITNKQSSLALKKIIITLLSLIMIVGGIIGAYYLYTISPLYPSAKVPEGQQQTVAPIVSSDVQVLLPIDNTSHNTLISKIQAEVDKIMPGNSIKEIVLTETIKSSEGKNQEQVVRVTGPEMVKLLDIDVPDILLRSLTAEWMLGVYNNANDQKSVFIIVTNNFFQNAFAGMLQWEPMMVNDLKQYLLTNPPANTTPTANMTTTNINMGSFLNNLGSILPTTATNSVNMSETNTTTTKPRQLETPTSTMQATSTIEIISDATQPYLTLRGQFKDRLIKNRDVREFITDNGRMLFLYSFIDNSKLVITGSESALIEILTRLEKQSFMR